MRERQREMSECKYACDREILGEKDYVCVCVFIFRDGERERERQVLRERSKDIERGIRYMCEIEKVTL
jgi:hypothetical protein